MSTLVQRLAAFVAAAGFADLPPEVVASVKLRVLDTLGISLAAWPLNVGKAVFGIVEKSGGAGEAAPIGRTERFPAEQAAFVSGTLAHALDFDDTHLPSILHPSAIIVPAALTAAQSVGASGKETIAAAAIGYEVCVRIGMAAYVPELRNSVFFEKGLHGASIAGALGAAAVATKLRGGSAEEIAHAIGIAASMAAGLLEANRTGGTVKQIHGGWACHAGLWAAKLAAAGFTGPPTVLEGRFGLFYALCDNRYDPAAITAGLGERWETPGIFFKPYPANHFTHAGIDAAIAIRRQYGPITRDDVEAVELGVAAPTLRTIAEPRQAKVNPESGYAARFSGPFTVASALLGGGGLGVYLDDFTDEAAQDPARRALAAKVTCYADERCEAVYPQHFPSVLRVHWRDGTVVEQRVMENRGSPARPLSPAEVRQKFELNAARALSANRADGIAGLCDQLETLADLRELVSAWAVSAGVPSTRQDHEEGRHE